MAPQDDKKPTELKSVEISEEDAWKLVKLSAIDLLMKGHEEKDGALEPPKRSD